jgi:diguanylate cyclase (GGDEF)-like protein
MIPTSLQTPIERAEAAFASGDMVGGRAEAESAWSALDPDDAPMRRRVGLLLAQFRYRTGALPLALDLALEILPLLRAGDSSRELIDLLRLISLCASDTHRFDVALACAQEAHRLAVEIDDAARISLSTNVLGCFFERTGDPWQAERLIVEALNVARTQPERHPLFTALNNLAAILIGKYYLLRDAVTQDEARDVLLVALPHAREAVAMTREDEPFYKVFTDGNLGEILVNLGDAEGAEPLLSGALALAHQHGFEGQTWRLGCSMGEWQLLQGRPDAAWTLLSEVLGRAASAEQGTVRMRLHHALWRAAVALGRTDDALFHLQAYLRLERLRSLTQLRAQSDLFVTRMEAEHMRVEARRHHARARELEADARRDELTGLSNRRDMEQRWPRLMEQSMARDAPLSVAMLDLDHFKQVNDRFGHAVGDQVLVALAGLLRANTRSADLVVRLGGEEFLLLMPDTPAERAFEVCERLRLRVAAHPWERIAPGLAVTLSGGLSCSPPYDASALSLRADAALYRAKEAGRNRLVPG